MGLIDALHTSAAHHGIDVWYQSRALELEHDDDGVTVCTNQGDFSAPYAVVTLPHAVLAGTSVEFSPGLPVWKREAIKKGLPLATWSAYTLFDVEVDKFFSKRGNMLSKELVFVECALLAECKRITGPSKMQCKAEYMCTYSGLW